MSNFLDDELPKNIPNKEDDFFSSKPKNELPYIPSDPYSPLPSPPKKQSGCFFLTPLGCIVGLCIGMFACTCILPAGLAAAGVGFAALLFTNEATASGQDTLVLERPEATVLDLTEFSNSEIIIQGTTGNDITLNYTILAYGLRKEDAQNLADSVTVSLDQQANRITINTSDGGGETLSFYNTEFVLTVPFKLAEIILNPTSELSIKDVTARYTIDGGLTDINLTNVSGQFDVSADLGNITFSGDFSSGSTNRFETSLGNITMTLQEPLNLSYSASTNSGNFNCPNPSCSGGFGDKTSSLNVITTSGDITIRTTR